MPSRVQRRLYPRDRSANLRLNRAIAVVGCFPPPRRLNDPSLFMPSADYSWLNILSRTARYHRERVQARRRKLRRP